LQISQFEQGLTEEFVKSEKQDAWFALASCCCFIRPGRYLQTTDKCLASGAKNSELERQLQASQSTYSLLLQKFQEIQIAENQNVGNARVISSALVPEDPVASRKLFIPSCSSTRYFGFVATIYKKRDKSIKTVEEARECLDTLLG